MKNSRKGFIVPLLLTLLALLIVGGGVYVYVHDKTQAVPPGQNNFASTTVGVSVTLTPNQASSTASISTTTNNSVLDCYDSKLNVKDAQCVLNFANAFEKNLQSCTVSKGTVPIGWEPALGIFRSYNILGVENNVCVIDYSFLNTNTVSPTLLNKTMTCTYEDSERTVQSVANTDNCSGPLYDALQKLKSNS